MFTLLENRLKVVPEIAVEVFRKVKERIFTNFLYISLLNHGIFYFLMLF